jgi:hypothetical protein
MNMVMDSFERANGFSVLTADELFFVNGGSTGGAYISLGGCDVHGSEMWYNAVNQAAAEAKVVAYNQQGYYDYSLGGNPHG